MQLPAALALCAVFAQVALTLFAIFRMGQVRLDDVRGTRPDMAALAIGKHVYSNRVSQFQNNAHNQFETPQLLYAGVAFALILDAANYGVAAGALAYMGTRLLHRHIHVGTNRIGPRFRAYTYGLVALGVLWISLGVGVLFG